MIGSRRIWTFAHRERSITSRPTLAVKGFREITADVTPVGASGGTSNSTFDVAADGRIIVTERVRGSFDLVLVRNGTVGLGKRGTP